MRFSYSIAHIAGKLLYIADTLSRAPLRDDDHENSDKQAEVESFIATIIASLPASQQRLLGF